jgi:hypothetical protein
MKMLLGFGFAALAVLALALPVQAEEAARVGDPYPLNVCAVSGEPLGSMGDPIVHVKDGREVKFCCGGCTKKYDTMTEQFSAQVDEKIIDGVRELGRSAGRFAEGVRGGQSRDEDLLRQLREGREGGPRQVH